MVTVINKKSFKARVVATAMKIAINVAAVVAIAKSYLPKRKS